MSINNDYGIYWNGETGPQGPEGPQGPQGPNVLPLHYFYGFLKPRNDDLINLYPGDYCDLKIRTEKQPINLGNVQVSIFLSVSLEDSSFTYSYRATNFKLDVYDNSGNIVESIPFAGRFTVYTNNTAIISNTAILSGTKNFDGINSRYFGISVKFNNTLSITGAAMVNVNGFVMLSKFPSN